MSRERELLERVMEESWDFLYNGTLNAIKDYLAQPEQEPLTREEISYGFRTNDDAINAESYWAGVEWAEKMHGIGGEE